jgi:prepilin-type N-terminal cleavage/methylation domain-containing protein
MARPPAGQNEEIMEHRRTSQSGFTLMELMVVIVIVAILAAVAVPLYINYVKDAKRSEAKGAIAAVISAEQVHYQSSLALGSPTYITDTDLTDDSGLKVDLEEVSRSWTITVTEADANSFTVVAQGVNDASDLYVCCTYVRTGASAGADWGDSQADCGGGAN